MKKSTLLFLITGALLLASCTQEVQNTNHQSTLLDNNVPEISNQPETDQKPINLSDQKNEPIEDQSTAVSETSCITYDDFEPSTGRWYPVLDGVMGGRSTGDYLIQEGALIFQGKINTNGGGFASVRSLFEAGTLSEIQKIRARVKSDGRDYEFTIRERNGRGVSYQARMNTVASDTWQEIDIPINAFEPSYFGRSINVRNLNTQSAIEIGIILSDGIDGDYLLRVDEISLCK